MYKNKVISLTKQAKSKFMLTCVFYPLKYIHILKRLWWRERFNWYS